MNIIQFTRPSHHLIKGCDLSCDCDHGHKKRSYLTIWNFCPVCGKLCSMRRKDVISESEIVFLRTYLCNILLSICRNLAMLDFTYTVQSELRSHICVQISYFPFYSVPMLFSLWLLTFCFMIRYSSKIEES